MEALRRERATHQALAAQPGGISARFPRVWPGPIRSAGTELDVAQLPVDAAAFEELQDPTTGQLYFVPGISLVDGSDLVQ